MKMTASSALNMLNLTTPYTTGQLKQAYKKALLSSHPDKGGSTEETQALNKAYSVLKKTVSLISDEKEIEPDWFSKLNELHPLHTNRLPAVSSYESLIERRFNIVAELTLDNLHSIKYIHKRGGVFVQCEGEDYNVDTVYGQWKDFSITNITHGGRRGKYCEEMRLNCEIYGPEYTDSAKIITNPLREWFGEGLNVVTLFKGLSNALYKNLNQYEDIEIKYERRSEDFSKACLSKNGTFVYVTLYKTKSHNVLNPFTLKEIYKPLKAIPKKFTIRNLVQVLVNGQFYKCKCNRYLTDDYAMDAALKFCEGYIDNPIDLAATWHNERKDGCTRVYLSDNSNVVNFGTHSNESYSLTVKLDNEYPLIDLDYEIQTLEISLLLNKKAG